MKVIIVGGGTCGLYLALKLSKKGNEITVFEKKERVGKEVCSGLFSERIFDFLPEAKNLIENKIDYCLIHFPKKTVKIEFLKKFFHIDHFLFDNLLFESLKGKAKIVLGKEIFSSDFEKLKKEGDKIIGCDGAFSETRKFLKLPKPNLWLAIQGFVFEKNCHNFVETWPQKSISGFIWKIPGGKKTEYGIIGKPEKVRDCFENFLAKRKLVLKEKKSAFIARGLVLPSDQKITLCGEAAGLTKPWSGGGVVWGLKMAEILIKNFPDFQKYKKEVENFFRPQIFFSEILTRMVYFFGFNFPWFLPKQHKIDGDFI
jgi:flavin-dependent dehydrogenase